MSSHDASRIFYEWKRQYKLVFEFGVHSEQEFEPLWGSEEVNVLDFREFSTSGSSKNIFRQDIEKRDEPSLANV